MNYVKRKGTELLDVKGQAFTLRGVGFGGWLLPEGYMWRFPKEGDRPRKIEAFLGKLYTPLELQNFWKRYKENFITEADIILIKEEGFNSIRLPFNARTLYQNGAFIPEEIALIDQVIAWCEKHQLYVILDMHAAPGGQTGANIDDSEADYPALFSEPAFQKEAIALWKALALRYCNQVWVAGYDLLNEPLPEWFSKYNHLVVPLYKDMIEAIRQVDQHHMIIVEGVHWATDFSIFTEPLDENILYQFHKYWNNPDQESIQKFLNFRDEFQVPLFMGEGGENNTDWYTGAFHLFDSLDISWNFWTYKKMDTTNSLFSIEKPADWSLLIAYLQEEKPLDKARAKKILEAYVANLSFTKASYYPQVTNSLLRKAPVSIPSIFYDYASGGHYAEKRRHGIGFREQDQISMNMISRFSTEIDFAHGGGESWDTNNRSVIELMAGEWVTYTLRKLPQEVNITLRILQANAVRFVLHSSLESYEAHLDSQREEALTLQLKCATADTIKVEILEGSLALERIDFA